VPDSAGSGVAAFLDIGDLVSDLAFHYASVQPSCSLLQDDDGQAAAAGSVCSDDDQDDERPAERKNERASTLAIATAAKHEDAGTAMNMPSPAAAASAEDVFLDISGNGSSNKSAEGSTSGSAAFGVRMGSAVLRPDEEDSDKAVGGNRKSAE
jgi:hypothetical protein